MSQRSKYLNFTKKGIASLPIPKKEEGGQTYYDTGSKDGLCLIITYGGTKTFYAYMKFRGAPKRVKIGRFGQTTLEYARRKAHELKGRANDGEDPSNERNDDLRDMSLRQFYETQYIPRYASIAKKPTSQKHDRFTFANLEMFHNRKMISIQKAEIQNLHNSLKRGVSEYTANRALGLIAHIYAKAIEWGYPERHGNPARGIKKFKEKSRDRFLHPEELQSFFAELANEPNETFKNYVWLSLLIGQRRSNILAIRWKDIDFDTGLVYFADTKNGEAQQIPLTTQAIALLRDMKKRAKGEFVLPSDRSASGHFEEPKRQWQNLLARAGIEDLRLHDLRRTMGSYQAITGASLHIIGKSLGHKSTAATQIYSRLTADPVRASMQKATDKMLEYKPKG